MDKMESVGDILNRVRGGLSRGTSTPDQKTSEEPAENPRSNEEILEQVRRSLNVTSLDHRFENFRHIKGTDNAYKAFLALATYDDARPLLLCYGGVGNGKTYLCEALCIALYRRGQFCRLRTMSELMRTFKAAMSGVLSSDLGAIIKRYCHARHLVIDDVGMGGSGSDWEWGQLEDIVAARYRERRMTVLTTNLDPSAMPERIVSRFKDREVGLIVFNEAPDFRPTKRGEA